MLFVRLTIKISDHCDNGVLMLPTTAAVAAAVAAVVAVVRGICFVHLMD